MFKKADHQMKAGLSMLGVALVALLTQAVVVHAQVGVSRSAGGDSPELFSKATFANADVPADTSPALLALADVAGADIAAAGGLWLSGNKIGGLTYLYWIAGNPQVGLLKMDRSGKVSFNLKSLAWAAGVSSENPAEQRARIASFLRSNEGLRLLAEVTNGAYRYLLHVGSKAPTRAGTISHFGIINLDNRYDSRINPLRPKGQKLNNECPPEGFDSLVAIDPEVCWFNLDNDQFMPVAQMTFHELAEQHARLALGLDYMPQGDKPGAHNIALDREVRLKQERPSQLIVGPSGWNLRLASRYDWFQLFTELRRKRVRKPAPCESQTCESPTKSAANRLL